MSHQIASQALPYGYDQHCKAFAVFFRPSTLMISHSKMEKSETPGIELGAAGFASANSTSVPETAAVNILLDQQADT